MYIKKILMIDDEVNFSLAVKHHLESIANFRVDIAKDGIEGLRLAKEINPHLIILDINMPDMDGFEVLKRLKEDAKTLSIPVIVLSVRCDDDSKTKATQLYDELYLTKPIKATELRNKIEEVFKRIGI